MHHRWITLLVVFILSISIAVGCASLSPSRPVVDPNSVYQAEAQTSLNTVSDPTAVKFPADYQQQFIHYATVDCPNSQIVRKLYINQEPLAAIASSQTVPAGTVIVMETHSAHAAADGRLVANRLNNVFIREKQSQPHPDPDSGQWYSAWYSPAGSLVSDNQSSCIGCHTSVRQRDYLFTLPALMTAARTGQIQYQQTEFGTSVCR